MQTWYRVVAAAIGWFVIGPILPDRQQAAVELRKAS
jgi:hypothetical protein